MKTKKVVAEQRREHQHVSIPAEMFASLGRYSLPPWRRRARRRRGASAAATRCRRAVASRSREHPRPSMHRVARSGAEDADGGIAGQTATRDDFAGASSREIRRLAPSPSSSDGSDDDDDDDDASRASSSSSDEPLTCWYLRPRGTLRRGVGAMCLDDDDATTTTTSTTISTTTTTFTPLRARDDDDISRRCDAHGVVATRWTSDARDLATAARARACVILRAEEEEEEKDRSSAPPRLAELASAALARTLATTPRLPPSLPVHILNDVVERAGLRALDHRVLAMVLGHGLTRLRFRRVRIRTGSHTIPFALWTPFLKDLTRCPLRRSRPMKRPRHHITNQSHHFPPRRPPITSLPSETSPRCSARASPGRGCTGARASAISTTGSRSRERTCARPGRRACSTCTTATWCRTTAGGRGCGG